MSERELQDSDLTKQLKETYSILEKQGTVHGGWAYGVAGMASTLPVGTVVKHVGTLCVEGALQIATNAYKQEIAKTPIYQFVLNEVYAYLDEEEPKPSILSKVSSFLHPISHHGWDVDLHKARLAQMRANKTTHLYHYNDILGKKVIMPVLERCIAKSEAMDREKAYSLVTTFKIPESTQKMIREFDLVD